MVFNSGHARVYSITCPTTVTTAKHRLSCLKLLISTHREAGHFEPSLHELLLVFVGSILYDTFGVAARLGIY